MPPSSSAPLRGSRLSSLDGLRAVSIAGVLLAHASASTDGASETGLLKVAERAGSLGVLFFFVISGFLITTLLRREIEKTGRIDLRGFYLRRVLRIFPAFYTYLAVIAGLTASGVLNISAGELTAAGLHVWNYSGLWGARTVDGGWFLGHFWTLALEEQFYLVWPLSVAWIGLRRGDGGTPLLHRCTGVASRLLPSVPPGPGDDDHDAADRRRWDSHRMHCRDLRRGCPV